MNDIVSLKKRIAQLEKMIEEVDWIIKNDQKFMDEMEYELDHLKGRVEVLSASDREEEEDE